jgi:hypothetical protein
VTVSGRLQSLLGREFLQADSIDIRKGHDE